jgi:ABC-type glycerol-3-phosphate transport system substrate-binding protein
MLAGSLAAGTSLALGWLAAGGCRAREVALNVPAPQATAPVTVLRFAPWGQWTGVGPHWQQFVRPPLDRFEAAHRGLRVEVVPPVSGGLALPALLAGTAPDVFSEYDIVPYLQQSDLLANLAPLLHRDNISPTIWSQGQLDQFYTSDGLWFLPNYLNCAVMAINLGDLDEHGLSYPDTGWTAEEAARLFRAATWNSGGQHHYGFLPVFRGIPYLSAGPLPNATYALEIFGGSVVSADGRRCTLDDPLVIQAVEWWMQLFYDGVAIDANHSGPQPWPATFVEDRNNNLLQNALTWTKGYKWTFWPLPTYPAGKMGWVGSEGYAIRASTGNLAAAWTLLKFLAVEPDWQRYCMRTILQPPGLLSLWGEMAQVLEQVVPGFVGKGLEWFAESAAHWTHAGKIYQGDPVGAMNLINAGFQEILTRRADPRTVLHSLTDQVNALQAQGETKAQRAAEAAGRFPTAGPPVASVPSGV